MKTRNDELRKLIKKLEEELNLELEKPNQIIKN